MNKFFSLQGKTILITGASSGIGRQCAITASQFGANVILVSRNIKHLKETYNQLAGVNHLWFSQDITEYDKLEDLIKKSVQQIGKISGLVHSAGIDMTVPFRTMKSNYYEKLFSLNVIAGFELAKIVLKKKYLVEKDTSFVFISSVMGNLGQTGKVGYCSSKGALIAGCKAMAIELASKNLRVNCILPGVVKTGMSDRLFENISKESMNAIISMHPLGLGEPEDVAGACMFLLSDASKWVTGTTLVVDGGYSIA